MIGLVFLGCGGRRPVELDALPADAERTGHELEAIEATDEYHAAMVEAERILEDDALHEYLQARVDEILVARGLAPDSIRVFVVKNPYMNASMLANGVIHLHTGILARIENEGQLATLLGHEIGHQALRHIAREELSRQREESRVTWTRVAIAVVLAPTGLSPFAFIDLESKGMEGVLARQMSGYSRAFETEADRYGFEAMQSAGYPVDESVAFFQRLIDVEEATRAELNVGDAGEDPYIYASHPALTERKASYEKLIGEARSACAAAAEHCRDLGTEGGSDSSREARYMARIEAAVLDAARADRAIGRRQAAITILERLLAFESDSADAWELLGSIRSARGSRSEEIPEAIEALERAADLAPDRAAVRRELGFLYRKTNRPAEAASSFRAYLEAEPEARDATIIRRFIDEATRPDAEKSNGEGR